MITYNIVIRNTLYNRIIVILHLLHSQFLMYCLLSLYCPYISICPYISFSYSMLFHDVYCIASGIKTQIDKVMLNEIV